MVKSTNTKNKMIHTVVAFDPGSKNFAYSVLRVVWNNNTIKRIDIVSIGKLHNPLNDIKESVLGENHTRFHDEIAQILNEHKPDEVVIERFQTRGKAASFMGSLLEVVNIQVGTIVTMCLYRKIELTLLLAVTWKSAVKRAGIDINNLYKLNKKNPHCIDATLLGLYAVQAFDWLKGKKRYQKFVDAVVSV